MSTNAAFAAPSTPTKSSLDDDDTTRRTTDKCPPPPPPRRPSTSTDNLIHSMMMLNANDDHLAIPALHLNFQEFHHILPSPPTIMRIKLKPRFRLKPKHTQHCCSSSSSSSRPLKVCRTVKHATNIAFKKKTMVQKSMSTYQVVGRSKNNMMQVGRCRSASFGSPAA